jgi:bifunctional DNA-binding transcriptional regulator/antitoxin component of YhaV-PrlF toxin-antitoxin module
VADADGHGPREAADHSARTAVPPPGAPGAPRKSAPAARDTIAATPVSTISPAPNAVYANALVVNNDTITVDDVLEPLLPRIEEMSKELLPDAYYRRVVNLIREQIIEAVAQHLIWRRAQSQMDADMEPRLEKLIDRMEKERINREFNGSETRYTKFLTKRHKTRADVRQRLRRQIIIDNYLRGHLLPLVPSPRKRELRQYYTDHVERFSRSSEREMFLIDIPHQKFLDRSDPTSDDALEAARKQARTAIRAAATAIEAGEAFPDVAVRFSLGLNADKGGAWGSISGPLQGRWAAPSRRLFELGAGEVSEIIETPDSFFIVKAGKVQSSEVQSFQDAQPRIASALRQDRFATLRANFLQDELNQSTIGSLDAFVAEALRAVPPPSRSSP